MEVLVKALLFRASSVKIAPRHTKDSSCYGQEYAQGRHLIRYRGTCKTYIFCSLWQCEVQRLFLFLKFLAKLQLPMSVH